MEWILYWFTVSATSFSKAAGIMKIANVRVLLSQAVDNSGAGIFVGPPPVWV